MPVFSRCRRINTPGLLPSPFLTRLRLTLSAAVVCLSAACSTFGPAGNSAQNTWPEMPAGTKALFDSSGRLSVNDAGKGSYGNFTWQAGAAVQNIEVMTPLGGTVGILCKDRLGVIAENSRGERFSAPDIAGLSRNLLGFSLPFDQLDVWLSGYRLPGVPYRIADSGVLEQSGWNISRTGQENTAMPKRLELDNGKLNIRLAFSRFETETADAPDMPLLCPQRAAGGPELLP